VAFLLDTNVAIHLRDGDPMVTQKVAALEGAVRIQLSRSSSWSAVSIGGRHKRPFAGRGSTPYGAPFRRLMIWRQRPMGLLSRALATRDESCSTG
jgi:hypothetical protein